MPDIDSHVYACVEVPELGEYDRRTQSQPVVGKTKVEGPAVVLANNKDGTIDVAIYDAKPDGKADTHSRLICGGSHLTQATSPSDRGPGRWWV